MITGSHRVDTHRVEKTGDNAYAPSRDIKRALLSVAIKTKKSSVRVLEAKSSLK
jgi:hypothetical protein